MTESEVAPSPSAHGSDPNVIGDGAVGEPTSEPGADDFSPLREDLDAPGFVAERAPAPEAPLPARAPVMARGEAQAKVTPAATELEMMPLARVGDAPAISPQMTALFGGLFGLAVFASLVALLIQIFPVEDQRTAAAQPVDSNAPLQTAEADNGKASRKRVRHLLPSPWRVRELKDSHLVVSGTMDRRAFITALKDAGVPKAEVYRVIKAMEGVRKFDRTGKNDKFVVAMERGTKKVVGFEYEIDATEIYQAKAGDDGLLKGSRLDMKVREEEIATSFYIQKSFAKSYRAVGLEDGLATVLNKAFNGTTSVEAFEEGGVVRVIAVETTALGAFVHYERVRAVEYRPADPAADPVRAYWYEGGAKPGYVDEQGRRPSARGWRSPVPGAPVTSNFNPKRMHPVLKKVMPHNGTDFGVGAGTPIYAAYRGTVAFVGMAGASGNLVLIDHEGGIQTGYAHMSRFAPGIKQGDRVGTRQLIGYVGSTGRSTGPHLHFTAKRDGKFFDALELRLDALVLLPVGDRATFLQQKQQLDRALEAIPLPDPPEPEPAAEPEPASSTNPPASSADEGDEGSGNEDQGSDEKGDKDPGDDDDDDDDTGEDLMGPDLSGDLE